jgi:hypothetical protein
MKLRAALASSVLASVALITSCGGGDGAPAGPPIVGEIDHGIIVAITEYMATSGLDGDTLFTLADPPDCNAARIQGRLLYRIGGSPRLANATALNGLICVLKDKSTVGHGTAAITLELYAAPNITWRMDLDQATGAWRVTSVKFTGG